MCLQARGLCRKIRLHYEMSESQVLNEVRSTLQGAMCKDNNFPFFFLQTGGGVKYPTAPTASSSFTWTEKEVAKLSGEGCLYIQAQADLAKLQCEYNSDGDKEIDLTREEEQEVYIYECVQKL